MPSAAVFDTPRCAARPPEAESVYPRACGGTTLALRKATTSMGLSPRLRGNRSKGCPGPGTPWSIPAPAGEPSCPGAPLAIVPVYPRACGGTSWPRPVPAGGPGLSPRLRGNLCHRPVASTGRRSIPAPAGEPRSASDCGRPFTVYPRACGGTDLARSRPINLIGLSPRLRGNHRQPYRLRSVQRSIPAPAGEPLVGQPLYRQ